MARLASTLQALVRQFDFGKEDHTVSRPTQTVERAGRNTSYVSAKKATKPLINGSAQRRETVSIQ